MFFLIPVAYAGKKFRKFQGMVSVLSSLRGKFPKFANKIIEENRKMSYFRLCLKEFKTPALSSRVGTNNSIDCVNFLKILKN